MAKLFTIPKTSSKTRITDEINNKFPNVTDGSGGSTNFFSTTGNAALLVGLYPK